ncbi:hypothetical protein [Phocaeicola sp.]|uniref:hypothetical protein n=1 Tax=Phocaeicola sp. TaxID=2773926 RepID=UPI004026BCCA
MAQYFRIATKDFCNTLKPGSFTGDTMVCPTRSQIESAGLHIKKGHTYAADQLVPEDHIERLDWEYTFSVTPATATISAAGGSRKFTVISYKRQYSYSNAGNRIYVEGSQTNVAYISENSGSGTWTAASDTVSYSSNSGGAEKNGIITWTQSESFGSDPKKIATATHKQNADSIKPDGDGYSNPRITKFEYPTVIPASGGSSAPSYSYEQTVYWVSGKTTTLTSGGTPTFNRTSGTATVNSSSGLADIGSKGTTRSGQTTVAVVSLTVTMNGKSSPASSADVSQAENKIEETSWNSWNVSVSADRTNFPREGGTTTVRASATRTGTHTWSSGSTSSAGDSGTPSLSLSDTSGFSLSSGFGTSVTLTVSVNNGAERSTRITASYGGASDWVEIDQEVGVLSQSDTQTVYSISTTPTSLNWDYDSTSGKSFSVTSRAQDQIRYRYSYDGGSTWGDWGNWQNNGSSYSASYNSSITSGSSYFSISGNTVTPEGSNTTFSANTGTVTVSNAGDTAYVSLSQDGAPADYDYRISISPSSYNFSSSAGSHNFTVTVEQRSKPVTSSSWGSWSTIGNNYSSSISGTGFSRSQSGGTVTVNVTSNTSTTSGRSGTLTVTCDYTSDLTGTKPSASASLTQDKYVDITTKTEYQYEFSVSPASLSFSADGGTQSVTVTSRRRPVTLTYTNGSLTDESAGSWSTWSSYSGRIGSGAGFSVLGTSVTAGANSSTSSREGNLELTQTQTSDYSGSTSSYKSDSASINVPLDQMGADIKSVNFIHLSYSWQSKDGAYDIYSVYASASYKVTSTVIVECRLTYGSSLGAGEENYAFTISPGSTTSSARKCYTFAGNYPGVVSGTGSVRPSEDETYRYSFLE